MIQQVLRAVELLAAAGAIASIAYYAVCLWSASRFLKDSPCLGQPETRFAVSILKPLKGTDPEMYDCFRSHCLQEYGVYQIIFGVSDVDDPAIKLVERLKSEFPERDIQLVHCLKDLGSNTKVSNLAQMLPLASYEYILINDSDIRVPPDYLREAIAPLAKPEIGLVTCPYRGVPNKTLGSVLESLGIGTDFLPGLLVARAFEGMKFGLGSTLAFRRGDLESVGGFEAFLDYLADDYEIGQRIARLGMKIQLSSAVVDSILPPYTMRSFLAHQLRWARTIRNVRPSGYIGLGITFGLPWAVLALILAHGALWAWIVLAVTLALRFAVAAYVENKILQDFEPRRLLLLPFRDVLALFIWVISFAGRTVIWRGTAYKLRQGKLARIAGTGSV
jgi:ceramide glucosyltransferase